MAGTRREFNYEFNYEFYLLQSVTLREELATTIIL